MDGGTERNGEAGNAVGNPVFQGLLQCSGMVAAEEEVPRAVK